MQCWKYQVIKKVGSKLYAKLGYLDIFIIKVKIFNKKLKVFDLHVINKYLVTMWSVVFQIDSGFAYAYTLLGHEYVFTEELDKAMSCFRNAIRVDSRHYNAW